MARHSGGFAAGQGTGAGPCVGLAGSWGERLLPWAPAGFWKYITGTEKAREKGAPSIN